MDKANIFISYSHKDEDLKERLESHLHSLKRDDKISDWNDRKIIAGQSWKDQIDKNLANSDIVLLLISADFISSEYCYEKELKEALKRHENAEAIVIPLILRHTKWNNLPFSSIQALPKDGLPVTAWKDEDEAWLNIIDGISEKVDEILSLKERSLTAPTFKGINSLLRNELDTMDAMFMGETLRGYSSGLTTLDKALNGLNKEALIAIGGRPDMGHSLLSLQIVSNIVINQKIPTAIFSLNYSAEKITTPLLSLNSYISEQALSHSYLTDEDWPKLSHAVNIMKDSPLHIQDSATTDLAELKEKLIEIKESAQIRVIFIDSLQRLVFNERRKTPSKTPQDITSELAVIARELQISIIVTFNIEKHIENRPNKRPMLEDLDELNSLRIDADQLILLYRDEVYNPHSVHAGIAEILLLNKAFTETVEEVELKYNKKLNRFESLKP